MTKTKTQPQNVLEKIPAHAVDFDHKNGAIHILIPKIKLEIFKFLQQRLKHPYTVVQLDEYGTRVWNLIDDRKTVFDIANTLRQEFGDKIEPVYERLGLFINMLAQRRFITLRDVDVANP